LRETVKEREREREKRDSGMDREERMCLSNSDSLYRYDQMKSFLIDTKIDLFKDGFVNHFVYAIPLSTLFWYSSSFQIEYRCSVCCNSGN
jgi:hypothetical protein